ncbi:hypothetical protein PPH41_26865, partial [Burkholderia gladioli]|nr:hypothetical protein [Burkholderia gladioli]
MIGPVSADASDAPPADMSLCGTSAPALAVKVRARVRIRVSAHWIAVAQSGVAADVGSAAFDNETGGNANTWVDRVRRASPGARLDGGAESGSAGHVGASGPAGRGRRA